MFKKKTRSAPTHLENLEVLLDLFAAFVLNDGYINKQEADISFDILRHTYPDADHIWLAVRLEKAFLSSHSLPELCKSIRSSLDKEQILELALQLFLLVGASKDQDDFALFEDFLKYAELAEEGHLLLKTLTDYNATAEESEHLQVLQLGGAYSDLEIPNELPNTACKLIQCRRIIVAINFGEELVNITGIPLPSNARVRLRPHHSIILSHWKLTFQDIQYFFQLKKGASAQVIYLNRGEQGILAERIRSKYTFAKITIGFSVEIYITDKCQMGSSKEERLELYAGDNLKLPHYSNLNCGSGAIINLDLLRAQTIFSTGRVFLTQQPQSILVSNDPNAYQKVDLKLTPHLAEPCLLEITFDSKLATGEIKRLKKNKSSIEVDGLLLENCAKISDGSLIKLSPNQAIRCKLSEGLLDEERTILQTLEVEGINHYFSDKQALSSINFSLERGEMLCILGPSGCGKSTLLSILAGQQKPSYGHIRLNNVSLYQQRDNLNHFISYLPQEEALFSQLTVREHLEYAINIRKPYLQSADVENRVRTILEETSLLHLANRKVGAPDDKSLSGGERSRLNLGIDFASNSELMLFDEPIAGLSSKDSEHIINALQYLSKNKIIIASLHRPSSHILEQFQKVLLLDTDGKIAFFGTPDNMHDYFYEAAQELQISKHSNNADINADNIFDILETPVIDIARTNTIQSTRKFPPTFWQERFENFSLYQSVKKAPTSVQEASVESSEDIEKKMPIPRKRRYSSSEFMRLFWAHFWRSTLSKYRNRGTLYASFLQVPLLGFIIAWTLRASPEGAYAFSSGLHIITYLFLSMTVGMFLGLTNSAPEILRDRPTLRRERNYLYSAPLYVAAKLLSLSLLAALQCSLYITIGNLLLDISGMWLTHWIWMTATAITGSAIGILISSISKTQRAAVSAVPLVLVPQLLLCGTPLIPFEEMNRGMFSGAEEARNEGKEPHLSRIIPLRYAYEGITVAQATQNPFELTRRRITQVAEEIKQEKELAIKYSKDGIEEVKIERLSVLLKALTKLYAMEARTASEAKVKLRKLEEIAFGGSAESLKSLPTYSEPLEGEDIYPCSEFFVNERAEKLVLKNEIQRVNIDNKTTKNIFLAEKKYLGSADNPKIKKLRRYLSAQQLKKEISDHQLPYKVHRSWKTTTLCMTIICLLTLACYLLTTCIVNASRKYKT